MSGFFSSDRKSIITHLKEIFAQRKQEKLTGGATSVPFLRSIYSHLLQEAYESGDFEKKERIQKRIDKMDTVKDHVLVRYLCKELLMFFLVFFFIFFAIFFVNQFLLIIQTLLKKHVSFWTSLKLIFYYMPQIVSQSAPFATLVGFLVCLGRMVTDNEILILRASGLRYNKTFLPVIFMGLLISLFSFLMNDYFLPLGNQKAQRLMKEIASSNPAVQLEAHSVTRMDRTSLIVGDVGKTDISDLIIFDQSSSGKPKIIIAGKSLVKSSQEDGIIMQLIMKDAEVFMLNENHRSDFEVLVSQEAKLNIFQDQIDSFSNTLSPREMTSFDLWKRIKKMKKNNEGTKNTYMIEFNRKFSVPFGSIFFALLAFPLALVFGKKDGQTLGLIFGIVLSVAYWASTLVGQMIALKNPGTAFLCTWVPNFFLGALGVFLYMRLRKK